LADAVSEIASGLVASQRSMMVLRARMQTVETTIAGIGDGLVSLDARFVEIKGQALQASAKSRDTISLCEMLLDRGEGD
jgi:hypothetical protein